MSTFPGRLEEIPFISIDRFDNDNLTSKAFFLSHYHFDHMEGLGKSEFHSLLIAHDNVFLYCSDITALFLSHNQLRTLQQKIKVLPMSKPHTVNVPGHGCIAVTALPAGHCPGSVMFLFKHEQTNVLYTGDVRMTKQDILAMKGLKDYDGRIVDIHALYLDTTFSSPSYKFLPNRDESIAQLVAMCQSWLQGGNKHIIDLRAPAIVGVEYVLIKLYEIFHTPFHVNDFMYQKYIQMPDLAPAITKDSNSLFHACVHGNAKYGSHDFLKTHPNHKTHLIHSVKLHALTARHLSRGEAITRYSKENDLHRVVYSSHSSHSELLEMVEVLRPSKIVPCVVRMNFSASDILRHLTPQDQFSVDADASGTISPVAFLSEDEEEEEMDKEVQDFKTSEDSFHVDTTEKAANFTLAEYNADESSEEVDLSMDEADCDELPPFRWDCYYDARKVLGYCKTHGTSMKHLRVE